jgi:hypothetical protein
VTDERITIVTFLWRGWRPIYDHRHVNRLHRQLQKHMTGSWSLVCLTDMPEGIECETRPLPEFKQAEGMGETQANCFIRLALFHPEIGRAIGNLLMVIDLDSTVYSDLRPLITKSGFKAAENKKPRNGLKFCGTLWQLRPGYRPEVYFDYHPVHTPDIIRMTGMQGSDQSWFTLMMPTAPVWNEANGVYWAKRMPIRSQLPSNVRIVYFAGGMKPWDPECKMNAPCLYDPL